ncbi:caspase-1-A-like [Mantella aurantiaca]
MADQLRRLRKGLIDGCNKSLIMDLLDDLLDEGILSSAEVEYITEGTNISSDQMRKLVDFVWKKGNKASNILIQIVLKRDSTLSANLGITAPSLPQQEQNIDGPSQTAPSRLSLPTQEQNAEPPSQTAPSMPKQAQNGEPPSETDINGITLCSKKNYERIHSEEREHIYSILPQEKRTRLALIICNDKFDDCSLKQRNGAEFDVEGMEKLLDGLGYKVLKKYNLSVQEMKDTMKHFAAEEKHKTSDSTFIVLMSHGHRDVICGTDSNEEVKNSLHVDEIFSTFNNVNCSNLRDKPKVVIIQACRGSNRSRVLVADSSYDNSCALPGADPEHLEKDAIRMIQKETDFICFCSSTPDTFSWRDPKSGSLFIQRLIQNMKKDAYNYSIEDIFRGVQRSFKDQQQMPTQERTTFLKKFFLFPGH